MQSRWEGRIQQSHWDGLVNYGAITVRIVHDVGRVNSLKGEVFGNIRTAAAICNGVVLATEGAIACRAMERYVGKARVEDTPINSRLHVLDDCAVAGSYVISHLLVHVGPRYRRIYPGDGYTTLVIANDLLGEWINGKCR